MQSREMQEGGRAQVRATLSRAILVTVRHNPALRAFQRRLALFRRAWARQRVAIVAPATQAASTAG